LSSKLNLSSIMKRSFKLLSSLVGAVSLSASLSLPAIAQQPGATPVQQVKPGQAPPSDASNQAPVTQPPAEQQSPGSQDPTQGGNNASPDSAEEQPSVAPFDQQRQRTGSPNSQQAPANQVPGTRNPAPASPDATDRQPSLSPNNQNLNQGDNTSPSLRQAPANQAPGTRNPAPVSPDSTNRQPSISPSSQDPTQGGNNASPDSAEEQPSVAPFDQQRQRTGQPVPGNNTQNQAPVTSPESGDTRRGAYPDPIESLGSAEVEGLTIAEVVDQNDSFRLFNALLRVAAIEEPELIAELSGDKNYTVFAPTDRAFLALPEGTITQLVQPENRELLVEILRNHIVSGNVASTQMPGATASSMSESAQSNVPDALGRANPGSVAADAPAGATPGPVETEQTREREASFSAGMMAGEAQVIRPDIQVSNGVIHVIDRVILPPDINNRIVTPSASSTR
jgi:uncharacterized surface protein with fasciclin (FAS1) repeats